MRHLIKNLMLSIAIWSAALSGCGGGDGSTRDAGTGTDSGSDTDTDTDSDTGTDSDTDTDSDVDTDADTDTDSDSDTDADTDTDTDADTDSGLPEYCQILEPVNSLDFGWTGRFAMDNDHVVWRWIDIGDQSVLMARTLSTGVQWELLRQTYPDIANRPSIHGDTVCFDRFGDLFRIGLGDSEETMLVNESIAEDECAGGETGALYNIAGDDYFGGLRYTDYATCDTISVLEGTSVTPNDVMFDGVRWVAFSELSGDEYLYKFDLEDPDAGAELVQSDPVAIEGADVHGPSGALIAGAGITDVTNQLDLVRWNLETNERDLLLSDGWDQLLPDTSGHAVMYLDSNPAGEHWFSTYACDVKVMDLDTGVIRQVLPLDHYFGSALWSHWVVANNYGMWGDSLILCDLEAGGLMDADGHVLPEGGAPDAGADGGE